LLRRRHAWSPFVKPNGPASKGAKDAAIRAPGEIPFADSFHNDSICRVSSDEICGSAGPGAQCLRHTERGVALRFARPPIIGLDYEMDVRGAAREITL